ncbi:hypothetical protein C1H76_3033 [Elsinoe australis]|uniref:Uncharacterized protein n=1 Tax=Elsinoe australis TaxID=40998 RepID=A0A4U7B9N0_9PEZI|nr:hypothetical protein C1H76_3033 [Elsinoe australis]
MVAAVDVTISGSNGSSDRDLACSSGGGNFSFNDAGGDVPFSNSGDARPAVSPSYLSSSGGGEELSFNGVIDNFLSSVAVPTTGPPAAAATSSPPALPAAAVAANSPSTSQQQPVFDLQQRDDLLFIEGSHGAFSFSGGGDSGGSGLVLSDSGLFSSMSRDDLFLISGGGAGDSLSSGDLPSSIDKDVPFSGGGGGDLLARGGIS